MVKKTYHDITVDVELDLNEDVVTVEFSTNQVEVKVTFEREQYDLFCSQLYSAQIRLEDFGQP